MEDAFSLRSGNASVIDSDVRIYVAGGKMRSSGQSYLPPRKVRICRHLPSEKSVHRTASRARSRRAVLQLGDRCACFSASQQTNI